MSEHNHIQYNMPDADYRAHTERYGAHDLLDFARNPFGFFRRREAGEKEEPTEAMKLGTAVHAAVLTPDVFERNYVVMPPTITRRAGKAWEAFALENEGKEIIKQDAADMITGITDAIEAHGAARDILAHAVACEASAFYTLDGMPCKSRFDAITNDAIVDLKTTSDTSPEGFAKSCDTFGYDVQAAMYFLAAEACGVPAIKFIFIAVESSFPFTVGMYTVSRYSEFVRAGEMFARAQLAGIKRWADNPERPAGWIANDIILPAWSKRLQTLRRAGGIPF